MAKNRIGHNKNDSSKIGKLGGEKILIEELDDSYVDTIYSWIVDDEDDINQIK